MSRDIVVVRQEADIEAAKNLMAAWGVRRLPVVDGDGVVVGMVTLDDLNVALAEDADRLAGPTHVDMHGRHRGIPNGGGNVELSARKEHGAADPARL